MHTTKCFRIDAFVDQFNGAEAYISPRVAWYPTHLRTQRAGINNPNITGTNRRSTINADRTHTRIGLLREYKQHKLQAGLYNVTSTTRFRPDAFAYQVDGADFFSSFDPSCLA